MTNQTEPTASETNTSATRSSAGTPFESGAARLVYYDTGPRSERPLLVVAGGPGFDRRYMHVGDAFEQLAHTHRVVCYDQRGTGQASSFEEHFTNADYVDDIEALRKSLGVESFDLLGHSFGGYLAMAYAVEHAQRVRRLILVDSVAPKRSATTFAFGEAFPERFEAFRAWRAAVRNRDVDMARRNVDAYLCMLFCDPTKAAAWSKSATSVSFHPIASAVLWAETNGPDLTDAIRRLPMPTLVMTGRYDMNIPPRIAWEIKNAIPHARFLVFERSGHMPFYEEPEAFVDAVRAFLDQP